MTPEMHLFVERETKCMADFETAQVVIENILGEDVSRLVEVYGLYGHPAAKRAFIWKRGDDSGFHMVLGAPPVITAEDAVRSFLKKLERKMMED